MHYDLGFGDWVYEIDEVTGKDISNGVIKPDGNWAVKTPDRAEQMAFYTIEL